MVGQEAVDAAGIGLEEGDQTEAMGVFPVGDLALELHDFVGEDPGSSRGSVLSDNLKTLIGEGPGDEESAAALEFVPPVQTPIGTIKAVDTVGLRMEVGASDGHVMDRALAQNQKHGQVTAVVELVVELDGALSATKACPVKHAQAEVDGGRVPGIQRILEAELVGRRQALGSSEDGVKQVFEQRSRTALQGVGQRGTGDLRQPQVIEAASMRIQATDDRTQRVLARDLRIQQHDELLPGRKVLAVTVRLESLDGPRKNMSG